jgi:hypothetical protein
MFGNIFNSISQKVRCVGFKHICLMKFANPMNEKQNSKPGCGYKYDSYLTFNMNNSSRNQVNEFEQN